MSKTGKLLILTLVCVLSIFLYAVYELTLAPGFTTEKSFLPTEDKSAPNPCINWIMKNNSGDEDVVGWVDDQILVEKDFKNVFLYDSKQGKSMQLDMNKDYERVQSIPLCEGKVLIHYVYMMAPSEDFTKTKISNNDFNYSFSDESGNINDLLEIYDTKTNTCEKILEYKPGWRMFKSIDASPYSSFQAIGSSDDGHIVIWCNEDEIGQYVFNLYDVESGALKIYDFHDDAHKISTIIDIAVSNDGRSVYFTGANEKDYFSEFNLYQLDFNGDTSYDSASCKLLLKNINTFKLSCDDRYILYDYAANQEPPYIYNSNCLFLSNMKQQRLEDNVLPSGFAPASSGNSVAYIKSTGKSAQLYVRNLISENAKGTLICDFDKISTGSRVFIEWINDKKLLVSYSLPSSHGSEKKHSTCIVELPDTSLH